MQFDRAAPIQAVARGVHAGNMAGLEFYIGEDTVRDFSALFQRAVGAQVTFPGTDEAPWTVVLTGSAATFQAFDACVDVLDHIPQPPEPPQAGPQTPAAVLPKDAI
jgi:hypothetical protein